MYLATPPNETNLARYTDAQIGVMVTFGTWRKHINERWPYWAADNGCYGSKPWNADEWFEWLSGLPKTMMFATCPDVVGDARATRLLGDVWLPRMRTLGVPVAYVTQDGQDGIPILWGEIDWLFIGGSTGHKLNDGPRWCAEAKRRGIPVHFGRVNSLRRLEICAAAGADSADGTFTRFGPDQNVPKVAGWLASLRGGTQLGLAV